MPVNPKSLANLCPATLKRGDRIAIKPPHKRKSASFAIRVTGAEKTAILAAAQAAGLKTADYLREKILE